jgi:hypothetical protein
VVLCATLEGATGVALIADRGFVVRVLLGAGLSEGGIAIGRLAGLALPSLGLACWPSSNDAAERTICALFKYNLLAAMYLGYLRVGGGFVSYLLWPACSLQALLALLLARSAYKRVWHRASGSPSSLIAVIRPTDRVHHTRAGRNGSVHRLGSASKR